jgi:hypothetical protein
VIALSSNCLLFRLTTGECVPFSAEMISVELMGETASWFDADFVKQAAQAVFHYFRNELGRQTVTVSEFAQALEKVLRGFRVDSGPQPASASDRGILESDLGRLAQESGEGCELIFFPRLRRELRDSLQREPRVLRFRGLRSCVKQLAGARRWNLRCRNLEEQIVAFLRQCLYSESKPADFALLVE